jgi:hypothetical protein
VKNREGGGRHRVKNARLFGKNNMKNYFYFILFN